MNMLIIAIPVVWVIAVIVLTVIAIRGRRIAIVGIVVLVAPVVWFGWLTLRPDLYLNPLDRFFMTAYDSRTLQDPKSLIPVAFTQGQSKAEVEFALQAFGYVKDTARDSGAAELWFRKEGPFAVVCGTSFVVEARFGDTGLEGALAYREASCL